MNFLKKAVLTGVLCLWLFQGMAGGAELWREEFDQTCGKTGIAMELSVNELKQLLDRCAALQKIVEIQEESVRKVYLKRLQMCRNLYAYVLEYKSSAAAK